jgi:hypothetical protein
MKHLRVFGCEAYAHKPIETRMKSQNPQNVYLWAILWNQKVTNQLFQKVEMNYKPKCNFQ